MRDVFCSQWELSPASPATFAMNLDAVAIEDLRLSRATLGQAQIVNTPELGKQRSDLTFYLQVASSGQHVTWEGGEAVMQAGDIILLNSDMRCRSITEAPYTTVALTVPGDILRQYLPDPRLAVGRAIPSLDGLSQAASHLLLSLWDISDAGLLPELSAKVSRNLLEIFAASWSASSGDKRAGRLATSRKACLIRDYVGRRLRDPELSVESIASAFGISTRYVQMIFKAEGESLWCYIRRKRLEGCRADLTDPLWRDRSITTITYDWGFNSTAHFARRFREQYGVSPGALRRQSVAQIAAETP